MGATVPSLGARSGIRSSGIREGDKNLRVGVWGHGQRSEDLESGGADVGPGFAVWGFSRGYRSLCPKAQCGNAALCAPSSPGAPPRPPATPHTHTANWPGTRRGAGPGTPRGTRPALPLHPSPRVGSLLRVPVATSGAQGPPGQCGLSNTRQSLIHVGRMNGEGGQRPNLNPSLYFSPPHCAGEKTRLGPQWGGGWPGVPWRGSDL